MAVVAPPTQFGAYNPDLLATCHELGISEVYRLGGAQAVAALAYGVEGLPRVDKIVGPGNLFVALAKKHVYGEVDIDSIAGPSEVVVIADDSTRPDYTRRRPDRPGRACPGREHADHLERAAAGRDAAEASTGRWRRSNAANWRGRAWRSSGPWCWCATPTRPAALADEIAPEHLHIATDERRSSWLGKIRHAGAMFLGTYSPVAVGDYAAGPSHVLPTGGTARFASGLSANDFLRRTSVIALHARGPGSRWPPTCSCWPTRKG